MTHRILFDVCIADSFETRYYPLPWPVPVGDTEYTSIEVEFESRGGDLVNEAADALNKFIKENYPGKEYKFIYWTWLDFPARDKQ